MHLSKAVSALVVPMSDSIPEAEQAVPEINPSVPVPAAAKPLTVSVYPASDWPRLAADWEELTEISPYRSFYLSTDWITAWLQVFADTVKPQILFFEQAGEKVGACLLTRAVDWRGPFRVSRLYLNTGGEHIADRTLMEFNSLLCRRGREQAVAQALWGYLRLLLWDEFAIEGMCPDAMLGALQAGAYPNHAITMNVRSTFYVDLEGLRRGGLVYLDSLSRNTRSQIRRSLKKCRAFGPITVQLAASLERAEQLFEVMCGLHQSRWTARGETGAFCPGRRLEFHRQLIRQAYDKGNIHLLRVAAGDETVGVLYNFVQNGKIYFFQSGFNYGLGEHLKPGLVTHACAIEHYLAMGFSEYDFLAGAARYKASLAKNSRYLLWVSFARPSIKLSSIELLRLLKRRVQFSK